jgi:hypothetical protein
VDDDREYKFGLVLLLRKQVSLLRRMNTMGRIVGYL